MYRDKKAQDLQRMMLSIEIPLKTLCFSSQYIFIPSDLFSYRQIYFQFFPHTHTHTHTYINIYTLPFEYIYPNSKIFISHSKTVIFNETSITVFLSIILNTSLPQ